MEPQILVYQIANNNAFSLQIRTEGVTTIIKLLIKISRSKIDIYQIKLNTLNDIKRLESQFKSIQEFKEYIRNPNHFRVNLQSKTFMVVEHNQRKSKMVQIVSIPFNFSKTIQKDPQEELIQKIKQKCKTSKQLTGEQIKIFFTDIVMSLSQHNKQLKQNKREKQQQEKVTKDIYSKLQKNFTLCQDRDLKKEEWFINKMKNLNTRLQKHQNQLQEISKKQMKIEKWFEDFYKICENKLQEQFRNWQQQFQLLDRRKVNKNQIENQIKSDNQRINKQFKQIQTNVYNLIARIQKSQELLDRIQTIMRQDSKIISSPKNKVLNLEKEKILDRFNLPIASCINSAQKNNKDKALKWVDPECKDIDQLLFNGSTIMAKKKVFILGKAPQVKSYSFTVTFNKIHQPVGLGMATINSKVFGRALNKIDWIYYRNNRQCQNIFQQNILAGSGFKMGESVTVMTNFLSGIIQWRVGSQIRHQLNDQRLKDIDCIWVPAIQIGFNDIIEISQ